MLYVVLHTKNIPEGKVLISTLTELPALTLKLSTTEVHNTNYRQTVLY